MHSDDRQPSLATEPASLPAKTVLAFVQRLLEFPYPTICRHKVAADLLSLLEEAGYPLSQELARAVVFAHDDEAEILLNWELQAPAKIQSISLRGT